MQYGILKFLQIFFKEGIQKIMQDLSKNKSKKRNSLKNTNAALKILQKSTDNHRSSSKNVVNVNKKPILNDHQARGRYAVKKFDKNSKKNYLSKTALGTPYDVSSYMSCMMTPAQKSTENLAGICQQLNSKFLHQNFYLSKKTSNQLSQMKPETTVQIFFYISNRKYKKTFPKKRSIEEIKQQISDFIVLNDKNAQNYYGLIKFLSLDANISLEKRINDRNRTIGEIQEYYHDQIYVKPLIGKKKGGYQELQINDFAFLKYLGNGGFSKVYLARCKIDGMLCALKFIKKDSIVSEKKVKMIENEKNILFTIDHKRLVDLYYMIQSKNYIIFGLEYCPAGNLYQYLESHKNIPEDQAKYIFFQILEGLSYLHSQNILFRDIKLQNILFDGEGNIKITDFGLSKPEIGEEEITYSYCGSPQYMAPQMLAKCGHNFQIDHYALGILLYELLYGKSPFFAPKKQEIFYSILNLEPNFPKSPAVSKEVKSLIKGLLEKNPKHRIGSLKGTPQIFSHPWLRNYSTESLQSPFKKSPLSHGLILSQEQIEKINESLYEDIAVRNDKFQNNFVNKILAEELTRNIVKFRKVNENKQNLRHNLSQGSTALKSKKNLKK